MADFSNPAAKLLLEKAHKEMKIFRSPNSALLQNFTANWKPLQQRRRMVH